MEVFHDPRRSSPASLGARVSSLGTLANFVVHNEPSARLDSPKIHRYALQSEARRLLPGWSVADCHRAVIPMALGVDVYRMPQRLAAVYGNLHVCGSPWSCPVCAAKIAERRRVELEGAIALADKQGMDVYMVTFTFRHHRGDPLEVTLDTFLKALRTMWQRRGYRELRERAGLVGFIRALEVTWGGAGWHPHCHLLLFVQRGARMSPAQLSDRLRDLWQSAMQSHGMSGNVHAFDFRQTRGAVADYVAKWGHDPQVDMSWSASAEMVKSYAKNGRAGSMTPFALLRASLMGDDSAGVLFQEYAGAFKGRSQLRWSTGLRTLLGFASEEQETDEELAERLDDTAVWLGRLSREQWRFILGADLRGELLHVAAGVDWLDVQSWLIALGGPAGYAGDINLASCDASSELGVPPC